MCCKYFLVDLSLLDFSIMTNGLRSAPTVIQIIANAVILDAKKLKFGSTLVMQKINVNLMENP